MSVVDDPISLGHRVLSAKGNAKNSEDAVQRNGDADQPQRAEEKNLHPFCVDVILDHHLCAEGQTVKYDNDQ
jgi:hypothetical protein